jgi:hypothetical protein
MHQGRFSETTLSASLADAIQQSPMLAKWLIESVLNWSACSSGDYSLHETRHRFYRSQHR